VDVFYKTVANILARNKIMAASSSSLSISNATKKTTDNRKIRPYYRRNNCSSDLHDQSIDRYINAIIDDRCGYYKTIIPNLNVELTKVKMRKYMVSRIGDLIKTAIPKESYFIVTQ
jgi:hypothetical protein